MEAGKDGASQGPTRGTILSRPWAGREVRDPRPVAARKPRPRAAERSVEAEELALPWARLVATQTSRPKIPVPGMGRVSPEGLRQGLDLEEGGQIGERVADEEVGPPRLPHPQVVSGTAQLEVFLGDAESVFRRLEHLETRLGLAGTAGQADEAVARVLPASDAPPQLVQLRQAEARGVLDEEDGGVGHVD